MNGGLLPLNLSLVVVIGLFLWAEWREAILQTRSSPLTVFLPIDSFSTFQRAEGVQTACALWWIFLADAIRAGAAWSILNFRLGVAPVPTAVEIPVMGAIAWVNAGFIIAGVVGLIASLRCIYLFTPPRWGHWYWIGSVVTTLVFQIVT